MNRFEYHRPTSIPEAIAAAARPDAAYLAAGTNLLDLMKGGIARPGALIDITHLPGLDAIEQRADGSVRIGALVRNADLAHHPHVAKTYPAIAEALLSGASAQLRNAATAGGNLMQRTRCHYFYDPASACNKREPGAGCNARHGDTRQHAILGWSAQCIATHPSDFCVPLAALGAMVEIEGQAGRRHVAMADFHLLPSTTPNIETCLAPGDLITAIILPPDAASFARHAAYLKIRDRTSYAFAIVSCAAALVLERGVIAQARIALGGVAAKPWRSPEAEAMLIGVEPTQAAFRAAADAILADARPSGDNAFKIELARRLIARALARAAAGTPARISALPASAFAGAPVHA